jgi:internalin A
MRSTGLHSRTILGLVVLASWGPLVGQQTGAEFRSTQVLHFPRDQYLGSLHVEDPCLGSEYMELGRDLSLPYGLDPKQVELGGDYDFAGLAHGDVTVPSARNVKLMVTLRPLQDRRRLAALPPRQYKMFDLDRCRQAPDDLSGLSTLDPNDLWAIIVIRLVPTARADEQVLEPISRLTGLRVLELHGTGVTDKGLERLRSLRSLGALEFMNEPFIGNRGLAVLKDLPGLEYLGLDKGVTDAGLKHVGQIRSLRWLRLQTGRIWGPGLAELANLPRLERLCIMGSDQQLSDRHIEYLERLDHLKSLTLWSCSGGLTDASLASIGKLKNLEELHFIGWDNSPTFTPTGVTHLRGLNKLREIDFALTWIGPIGERYGDEVARRLADMPQLESITGLAHLSAEGMKAVATLKNLKRLQVGLMRRASLYQSDTGLSYLASLPSLEELNLGANMELCDADLVCLESMTHLKDLSVSGFRVTDAAMASVGKLHRLEHLNLGLVHVGKRGLNQLNGLKNLRTLHLVALREEEATVDEIPLNIASLKNLKTLAIKGVVLRDADLASLARMSDLEWLALDGPLTEDGLMCLKGLDSLKFMRIDGLSCPSGEGLAHLADLPRLAHLHLTGRITDAALSKAVGSAFLWSLTAGTDEPIRRETVDRLKQTLPSVEYIHIDRLPKSPAPSQQPTPVRPGPSRSNRPAPQNPRRPR